MTCAGGTLNTLDDIVRTQIASGVRFIIINSLEFSSKDYRRKDDLLYQIKIWANEFDVSIILFSERVKSVATKGKIQRGSGAGKFACVAAAITYLSEPEADTDETLADEGMTGDEWLGAMKKKQREEEERIKAEEEKAREEAELIERAQVLAREQAFLAADVPIWKAEDKYEEEAVIKTFRQCHVEFYKGDYESDEHYHRRLMAAIAVDLHTPGTLYNYVEKPYTIVHANNPDLPFEEELLPEGVTVRNYYRPDKLPIRIERKPRLKKEDGDGRELLR
jgi:hypothetical protein